MSHPLAGPFTPSAWGANDGPAEAAALAEYDNHIDHLPDDGELHEYVQGCDICTNLKAQDDALELAQLYERFGNNDQWEDDETGIMWKEWIQVRVSDTMIYEPKLVTFMAARLPNGFWYLTGRSTEKWSWDRLLIKHLANATESWWCSEWQRL